MSDIQQQLAGLADARVTTTVLQALDYVVPGEWSNFTSLEGAIQVELGLTDPAQVAAVKERSLALFHQRPHYQRAITIFNAVDTADKVAAAAVAANQVGGVLSFLSIFQKVTPKPDTTQAIDAALKLAAEVAAFATLRGLPVHSLAEAQAFPAALATYAKADMMRLAAWITIDGLLPLGPGFVQKIVEIVRGVDTSVLTNNPLFGQIKDALPGGNPAEQKGFILSTLDSGAAYVSEFVSARGLTQESLASKLGTLVNVADKGMDVMAATLDATTNYYAHTGLQSVARVLVHDAMESLQAGEVVAAAPVSAPDAQGSSWFKTAAMVGGVGAGVAAVGAVAGAAALWNAWSNDDDDEDEKSETDDLQPDASLAQLDDNALAAREAALEMQARQILGAGGPDDQKMRMLQQLRMQRRQLRRARRLRMRMMMRQRGMGMGMGRPGMGMGMGRRMGGGMGGGMGRGGGRGRF